MRRLLDSILNRFSMYTVVSISLSILFVVSLLLSSLGEITYSVWQLLASAIVLLGSTFTASVLFGWLFRAGVHAESSFITGMILTFIMTPTVVVEELLLLAVVGLLAGASKFLLAWKGRHIFNPVAAGVFIASVFGIAYASWWVATPPLFIFILIPTLLILYKTRRLGMGLVFAVVAVALLFMVFASYGLDLAQSAALLLSWPLLFFLGFMLTEPLTMPAKAWQRYVYAVIVAIIFAVPFSIGAFETSAIVALLVGNLFAFIVSHRHGIRLTFQKRIPLTPTTDEIVFKASRPIRYEAGQYMELMLPHPKKDLRGIRRMFSVASASNNQTVTFGVKYYEPSSTFKKHLRNLKKGDSISATGVNGDFVAPKNIEEPVVYVAGGIGITPFIAQLRDQIAHTQTRDTIVVYAVTSVDEIAYVDVLKKSGAKVYIVTPDTKTKLPDQSWLRIEAPFVNEVVLRKILKDAPKRCAYVSGPPPMVNAVAPLLRAMNAKHVRTDYFTGY